MITPLTDLWSEALRKCRLFWWTWAASEIDPLHPDVPLVVHRLNHLRRTTR